MERATRDYSVHPIHVRRKRGLSNLVSSASKFLFGTATEGDGQDLRKHYINLLCYALTEKNNASPSNSRRKIPESHKKVDVSDKL